MLLGMRSRIAAAFAALALVLTAGAAPAAAEVARHAPGAAQPAAHIRKPLAGVSAKRADDPVYHYVEGYRTLPAPGASQYAALVSQHSPYRHTTGAGHTLFEIAVMDSQANRNIVEAGWTKEQAVCGQLVSPCFFVYSWINNVGQGYNANNPGWVDNPTENAVNAGTALASTPLGSAPTNLYQYRIERTPVSQPTWQNQGPGWQIIQKNQGAADRIPGYFPDTHWSTSAFGKFGYAMSFYEVASYDATPCDDMGSGVYASSANPSAAAVHAAMSFGGAPAGTGNTFDGVIVSPAADSPAAYRVYPEPGDPDKFKAGGVGYAGPHGSTSTAAGTLNGC